MKNLFAFLGFVAGLTFTSSFAVGANHSAPPAAPAASAAEGVNPQTIGQRLQQFNELSRRVHDRHFRGAADEDQLKVQATLPKPERGAIGAQMASQDNADHEEQSGEEQQHD